MTLGEIGEDRLIERLKHFVPCGPDAAGPGDDCAVIDRGGDLLVLLKTDALVEEVHFLKEENAERVGWKAIARVFSDFASMGGVGHHFMVTIALRKEVKVAWVDALYRGIGRCLSSYGGVLSGGECCSVPAGSAGVISISAEGSVERDRCVLRSGGQVKDGIWVTGRLGGSRAGKHLDFLPRVEEGIWLGERTGVRAMMDLSDGLAMDLPRLAAASGCGFRVDNEMVPLSPGCGLQEGLCDGEDFELLIAGGDGFQEGWAQKFPDLELTRIGELVEIGQGQDLRGGWDHYK